MSEKIKDTSQREMERKNNAREFLDTWDGIDSVLNETCRGDEVNAKKVKEILLKEVVIEGDLEGDKGYSRDRRELGIANLTVKGRDPRQTLEFFRPIVEDFAGIDFGFMSEEKVKKHREALEQAKSGNFEAFALLLMESTRKAIPVPNPSIVVGENGMTYTTASGGCEVSIDMENNFVRFEKLDESQGTGPYSYMRGDGFFRGIVQELYRDVKGQDIN